MEYVNNAGMKSARNLNKQKESLMKFDVTEDEIKIYDFDALQALKIGRHLENEGIDFFNKLLTHGKITDQDVKDSIEFLIQEEKNHLGIIEKKIDESTSLDEDGFEEEDLEDFIDTKVFSHFNDIKNRDEIFHNIQEAIEFGIMVEKKSIMFYKALLEHEENQTGREMIKELILQENEHLAKLKTYLKE